jgi:hypothetical protein
MWLVVGIGSLVCFLVKYVGHIIPGAWLSNPRLQRINALIPISLLSALVVTEGLAVKTHLAIDHRLVGVAVAIAALFAKLPFPVVVLLAAGSSALVYHLH